MTDLTPLLGVPGVRAAVSGRADGNMGFSGARDPAEVRAARRRFLTAVGLDPAAAAAVRQVHGSLVLAAGPGDRGRGGLDPAGSLGEADGIVTAEGGLPLLVLAGDCCTAALASEDGRAAGIFHAGWRGALARAPAAAVRALEREHGVPAAALRAVLGPAIGPCCYEVGEDVAGPFRADFGPRSGAWLRPGRGGRPHLDLPAAVRAGLLDAGLRPQAVGPAGPCTRCAPGWFSHRGGDGERQLMAVAIG